MKPFLYISIFLAVVATIAYFFVKMTAEKNAELARAEAALKMQQYNNDNDPTGGWLGVFGASDIPNAIGNIKSIFK